MKQKQHSSEEIIRILQQVEEDQTVEVCIDRPIAIAPSHRYLNRSNSISGLPRCIGDILAMAIVGSGRYWQGKAGRSAASRSSASDAKRA